MIETTHCSKHCVVLSTEPICIETVKFFLSFCCVKALNSAVWSHWLTSLRHDHFFETSRFVLLRLETLQICIKFVFCVESCRKELTHWVRVKLASTYWNNRFANICGVADVVPIKNNFTCKPYWRSSNHFFPKFWQPIFITSCEWIRLCTGRTVQTKVGQLR